MPPQLGVYQLAVLRQSALAEGGSSRDDPAVRPGKPP